MPAPVTLSLGNQEAVINTIADDVEAVAEEVDYGHPSPASRSAEAKHMVRPWKKKPRWTIR